MTPTERAIVRYSNSLKKIGMSEQMAFYYADMLEKHLINVGYDKTFSLFRKKAYKHAADKIDRIICENTLGQYVLEFSTQYRHSI